MSYPVIVFATKSRSASRPACSSSAPARSPGLDALTEIVRHHLCRVPFENVSELYRMKTLGLRGLPALDLFLDGIERFGFGGTCYTDNYDLHVLLAELGYRVRLCGADMSSPDVRLVSMVEVHGRDDLVDVGYASPFMEALSRDRAGDHVIHAGDGRYVLKPPDEDGRSRMELYRAGTLTHRYTAKPEARAIAEFEGVIAESFRETATFMNALLVARFCPDRSLVVRDLRVTEVRGSASVARTSRHRLDRDVTSACRRPGSATRFAALRSERRVTPDWPAASRLPTTPVPGPRQRRRR